ncbi:MarR family winged helix-turn-helix transcriptional regulator [Desmospora activa]|uniref:DNA-binding MarR family transcriptional regulator n=1 Tax=Desmospora activa DSM 45169 TaxID=1121389 RepID=A0A2T4ZA24_9BACL|nr:MarR family winged helix-turn-helix transcriptional regulator [Desmospora activa]PTM58737.1 DNA-binding MarR family transcriptional regulator [Desmospora activa DSM 45169]
MDNHTIRSCSEGTETPGKYISAIYRHLQILISDRLQPYRIGSGQYIFLLTIAKKEGISQKALSKELLIDKTTTAKAIKKLEAEGYVQRETDPNDKRYHLLYLTESGGLVVPKIQTVLDEIHEKSRAGMDDDEYALMLSLLEKMLCNVSEQVLQRRINDDSTP